MLPDAHAILGCQVELGVRLNIKPTDFRDSQILINVQLGIGELGLPTDRITSMAMASSVMGPGGLGKLTVDQLNRTLSGRTYSLNAGMGADAFTLSGGTKPEDLDISWTDLVKQFVICLACFFSIWFCAVRNVCICMVDIYFVEQMGIHKIAVALFIRTSQSFIFIEIDSRYLRKIQVTVFVHFYQMFISSNRR